MPNNQVSIILPLHNGSSTIVDTLRCIKSCRNLFIQLIIVNDASSDDSIKKIGRTKAQIINHQKALGLAKTYNEGIALSTGDIIVTIHQDITFTQSDFKKLIESFTDPQVVISTHQVLLPLNIWQKFNFWQKLFFARKVELLEQGIDGKFDAFRKISLIQVGMFDENHFHSAGEDGDIVSRLKKVGRVVQTKARIIHLHQQNDYFTLYEVFRKQAQYSQAQGTLLRLARFDNLLQILITFFREILLISLLIPYLNIVSGILIIYYSFAFSWSLFIKTKLELRHLLVPFINIGLLFISLFYSVQGYIHKQQTI